jgi:hypothetical protein
MLGLQFGELGRGVGAHDDGVLLARAERSDLGEPQPERAAADARQGRGDLFGDMHVDVADETERQMVVVRIDPAGAGKAAAEIGQALADLDWNLDPGEEPRRYLPSRRRLVWGLAAAASMCAISASTDGNMPHDRVARRRWVHAVPVKIGRARAFKEEGVEARRALPRVREDWVEPAA